MEDAMSRGIAYHEGRLFPQYLIIILFLLLTNACVSHYDLCTDKEVFTEAEIGWDASHGAGSDVRGWQAVEPATCFTFWKSSQGMIILNVTQNS
jgi:hypothetical protein